MKLFNTMQWYQLHTTWHLEICYNSYEAAQAAKRYVWVPLTYNIITIHNSTVSQLGTHKLEIKRSSQNMDQRVSQVWRELTLSSVILNSHTACCKTTEDLQYTDKEAKLHE